MNGNYTIITYSHAPTEFMYGQVSEKLDVNITTYFALWHPASAATRASLEEYNMVMY